jgi:hypothetical protein
MSNFLFSYILLVLIPAIFIYRSAKRLISNGVDQKDLGDPGMWLINFLFLGWFGFAFYFYKRRKVLAQYNDAQVDGPQVTFSNNISYCPYCGQRLGDVTRYCQSCGKAITE